jgi:hypothetical protein
MSERRPPSQRTHYYLSEETWAEIAREYVSGVPGKVLADKWKVSRSAVYNRSRKGGWSRKATSEATVRAHAAAVAAAEQANAGPVAATPANLFVSPASADPSVIDPAALGKAALEASGRAMRGQLWTEARALASLAERYQRLARGEADPPTGIKPDGRRPDDDGYDPLATPQGRRDFFEKVLRRFTALAREELAHPGRHLPIDPEADAEADAWVRAGCPPDSNYVCDPAEAPRDCDDPAWSELRPCPTCGPSCPRFTGHKDTGVSLMRLPPSEWGGRKPDSPADFIVSAKDVGPGIRRP